VRAADGVALRDAAAVGEARAHLLFGEAVEGLVAAWRPHEGYQLSANAIRQASAAVAEVVCASAYGRTAAADGLPPWVSTHKLVRRLRERWMDVLQAEDEADGPFIARIVRAFDVVERLIDEHCAQRFIGRLSGPDAARLVVEMAHDMRSAMGSILFLSETVRSGASGPVTAVQQRQLGLIYSAALGLSGLVNDVVDLARGAQRLLDQPPVAFQLQEVVASLVGVVRPTAEEKGLALVVNLPDIGSRLGLPVALGRVLLNLLSNALKFTEVGTVRLDVTRGDGTELHFRVADTGRGMSPAVQERLFDAFRARDAEGDEYFSGAGLGLAMCQTLLTRMGSRLEVTSVEGRGTTFAFTMRLPFASLL
jgi:signal transduction histidine kinase